MHIAAVGVWITDGTPNNTMLLKEINASGASQATGFTTLGGLVLFAATDGVEPFATLPDALLGANSHALFARGDSSCRNLASPAGLGTLLTLGHATDLGRLALVHMELVA